VIGRQVHGFCGAPAHLIGMGGCVKTARPPRSCCTSSHV
jgi:hypothetical protein